VLVYLLLLLAPIPAARRPDPLAGGYLGVRQSAGGDTTLSTVEPGKPADLAGLKPGDVIVRIGAVSPRSFDELVECVYVRRPGTALTITISRGGKSLDVTLLVGGRPPGTPPPERLPDRGGPRVERLPPIPPNR
jgi:S1-C subfamily serine protease